MPAIKPMKHRAKTGCFLSHYTLLKHIVKKKLSNVVILEDDSTLPDLKKLKNIKFKTDGATYLGGHIEARLFKEDKNFNVKNIRKKLRSGINKINYKKWRVLGTYGYYIPSWKVALDILECLNKKNWKAIDIMYTKCPNFKYLVYPALVHMTENSLVSLIGNSNTKIKRRDFFKYY